jgi:pimeloyl-ACP methyl ester carboxylesterase
MSLRISMHNYTTELFSRWVIQRNIPQAKAKPGQIAHVRGHQIWYQDVGKGAPIVFLHGLGASSLSWLFTLPTFARHRRAIALDHIGHGRSDKPPLTYRITDFVDYLEGFLDQLNLSQVDLVGNSLGGWVAARLAVRRPELVRRLVLVGSAGLQPSPEIRARLEKVPFAPRTLADTRTILSLCFYNKVRYVNRVSVTLSYLLRRLEANHGTVESVIAAASVDPEEWMDHLVGKVRAHTLVLWGRHDELMPLEFAERYAREIPGAQLEILEECGHVPQIEKPRDFNRVLADFLA